MASTRPLVLVALISISMIVSPPSALAANCGSARFGELARASSAALRCRARAAAAGTSVEPSCTSQATGDLAAAFAESLASGDCVSADEADEIVDALAAFDTDVAALLVSGSAVDRCAAGKLQAAGRRVVRDFTCRRRAAASATAVDEDCLVRARAAMQRAFDRRDARRNCATLDDAPTVEALVSAFVAFTNLRIAPSSPTGLVALVDGASVDLSWTAPSPEAGLTQAKVLRRLDTAPSGPSDPAAVVVFSGMGSAAADDLNALLPHTTTTARLYHYAVYGCDLGGYCENMGAHATLAPTVAQVLKGGGYVLHWRHASADVCSDQTSLGTAMTTSSPDWWKSCESTCSIATARQLNTTGRNEAASIGDAFATRGFPVGRVLSSEFCRNQETASLMDFGPAIESSQDLTFFVYDEASRCTDTFALLAEPPTAGTNTALIGHAGNSCLPLSSLAWAEAAIYKPDGLGGSTFIAQVLAAVWLTLP